MNIKNKINKRHIIQWLLLPIVLVVISLGWKYTWLGFFVPLVMLVGIIGAFINGRYVCGNLCPRGAFFDRLITPISPQKPLPQFLRSMTFRWAVLVLLMGLMFYRLSQNFSSVEHWGRVFWLMCTATTLLGIVLAMFIRARTWCSFCPIGTLGKIIGEKAARSTLKLDAAKCVGCRLCEKACPMNLSIISANKTLLTNSDCIKCGECVSQCPRRALSNIKN
ncbi:MAG: iron-sulfur cluster-binding protein [uncultured bacterium]|nr:MAG: iron-sulfur cluster-binding protein [uncultured bacterium]